MEKQKLKLVTLVSMVEKEPVSQACKMNLESDAILINQTDHEDVVCWQQDGFDMKCISRNERGVGVSRNLAIEHRNDVFEEEKDGNPTADICLFSDEDIVYDEGYAQVICKEFEQHPEADGILFNMRVNESRRTYWNEDWKRVRIHNSGRYPAYSIALRGSVLDKSGVRFSPLFGGGAKYSNGEDSLFLRDLIRKKVRLYASAACLGTEEERESTWFHGYTDKFYFDRGVLYAFLYGPLAAPMAVSFLLRHADIMLKEVSFSKAYGLMKKGIAEGNKEKA